MQWSGNITSASWSRSRGSLVLFSPGSRILGLCQQRSGEHHMGAVVSSGKESLRTMETDCSSSGGTVAIDRHCRSCCDSSKCFGTAGRGVHNRERVGQMKHERSIIWCFKGTWLLLPSDFAIASPRALVSRGRQTLCRHRFRASLDCQSESSS